MPQMKPMSWLYILLLILVLLLILLALLFFIFPYSPNIKSLPPLAKKYWKWKW